MILTSTNGASTTYLLIKTRRPSDRFIIPDSSCAGAKTTPDTASIHTYMKDGDFGAISVTERSFAIWCNHQTLSKVGETMLSHAIT